ncbi:MAG: neutral/alkaline non-lysosomal ceramidase N-terminal domain-containing protein [Victivallales bacterium]|nr:neutral/alkaline non-lysosomal ceramidase N-terminal domain-containing protein [Victivallales bacterium]
MFKVGYAQEVITPPVGVGLAGYFNKRPNEGMYDDLMVKVVWLESQGKQFGFMTFDLEELTVSLFEGVWRRLEAEFGKELLQGLIISATHSHTSPGSNNFKHGYDTLSPLEKFAFDEIVEGAVRALRRATMNLLPAQLEVGSVYNNPYAFVRRYWMKNGTLITNPGWGNPDIDKPESEFDRTINILKVVQGGRTAAIIANIGNHGDTIGGNIVSADWYGRFAQEIQHELKTSLPVLVVDDASGDLNHFDFHQKINQSSYAEAVRIGRGYARIVLEALDHLEPVEEAPVEIKNATVVIPHRRLTDAEVAEAKHILATVPDIPKEGDFESQDLANKVPAALRYFARRALDCQEKSTPSHSCRLTSIKIGKQVAFTSLPGEPFNGISRAIRAASPCKYTFVIELAQSRSGYVPMPECFEHGGYEVQPGIDTVAPNAATEIINAAVENL